MTFQNLCATWWRWQTCCNRCRNLAIFSKISTKIGNIRNTIYQIGLPPKFTIGWANKRVTQQLCQIFPTDEQIFHILDLKNQTIVWPLASRGCTAYLCFTVLWNNLFLHNYWKTIYFRYVYVYKINNFDKLFLLNFLSNILKYIIVWRNTLINPLLRPSCITRIEATNSCQVPPKKGIALYLPLLKTSTTNK